MAPLTPDEKEEQQAVIDLASIVTQVAVQQGKEQGWDTFKIVETAREKFKQENHLPIKHEKHLPHLVSLAIWKGIFESPDVVVPGEKRVAELMYKQHEKMKDLVEKKMEKEKPATEEKKTKPGHETQANPDHPAETKADTDHPPETEAKPVHAEEGDKHDPEKKKKGHEEPTGTKHDTKHDPNHKEGSVHHEHADHAHDDHSHVHHGPSIYEVKHTGTMPLTMEGLKGNGANPHLAASFLRLFKAGAGGAGHGHAAGHEKDHDKGHGEGKQADAPKADTHAAKKAA